MVVREQLLAKVINGVCTVTSEHTYSPQELNSCEYYSLEAYWKYVIPRIFPGTTADTSVETAAMQAEKAMCWSGREWPRSCREKFLQAWEEKVKRQHSAILSAQELECQSAAGIPAQGNVAGDKPRSHLQRGAIAQPSENAFYVLRVKTPPQGQQSSNPRSFSAPRHYPQNLPTPQLARSPLDLENEGELIHICVSDLLLGSPGRKRPRLLPPNRKMHVEVWKKRASHSLQEGERSPVPPEYSHLVDTMTVTKPADLPEVESFYRRFSPRRRHRRVRPTHLLGEGPSPATGTEAAACQPRGTKRSHEQHLLYSSSTDVPSSHLTMAAKEAMNTSQNGHLPPKKRYTQSCL
ncbi:UNVERIFIED_CONTAM: hypothetical protein K2H54_014932 [Gekko kuhli]